jgi:hypothetical protein
MVCIAHRIVCKTEKTVMDVIRSTDIPPKRGALKNRPTTPTTGKWRTATTARGVFGRSRSTTAHATRLPIRGAVGRVTDILTPRITFAEVCRNPEAAG